MDGLNSPAAGIDGSSLSLVVVSMVLAMLALFLVWVFATAGASSSGGGEEEDPAPQPSPPAATQPSAPQPYGFQGTLYAIEGSQFESQKNNVLPLWGRPAPKRPHKWNYYAVLDNGVQIYLNLDGTDCGGDYGCDELMDRDRIKIAQMGGTIYRFSAGQS